jgi:hypothetical protein
MPIRSFSSVLDGDIIDRSIDDDAPQGFRQELIDAVYLIFERMHEFDESRLHKIITQSLGFAPSGQPYGGFRYALSRDIRNASWERVYDLIIRLREELPASLQEEYRTVINQLLAGYRIVWDLGADGQLHRILPPVIQNQIEAAFRELSQPRFSSSLHSFQEGINAYNDRPQRGRDACKNLFDALEAVAKEIFNLPSGTFGNVLNEARRQHSIANETIGILQKLYDMANNHFRHGMTTPFSLKSAEIDFIYGMCVSGILLFIRL